MAQMLYVFSLKPVFWPEVGIRALRATTFSEKLTLRAGFPPEWLTSGLALNAPPALLKGRGSPCGGSGNLQVQQQDPAPSLG